jgi:hypothetical protein
LPKKFFLRELELDSVAALEAILSEVLSAAAKRSSGTVDLERLLAEFRAYAAPNGQGDRELQAIEVPISFFPPTSRLVFAFEGMCKLVAGRRREGRDIRSAELRRSGRAVLRAGSAGLAAQEAAPDGPRALGARPPLHLLLSRSEAVTRASVQEDQMPAGRYPARFALYDFENQTDRCAFSLT